MVMLWSRSLRPSTCGISMGIPMQIPLNPPDSTICGNEFERFSETGTGRPVKVYQRQQRHLPAEPETVKIGLPIRTTIKHHLRLKHEKRKEKKKPTKKLKKKNWKEKERAWKRLFFKIVFATPTVIVFSTYVLVIQQHPPMPPCLPTPALLSRNYSWKDPLAPLIPPRDANSTFSIPVNCPILILYTRHWFCNWSLISFLL